MGYKIKFKGLEIYSGGQWQVLHDPADFADAANPPETNTIADQVAGISLPDRRAT
jgi:arginine-tRNA-protein transferase